VRFIAYDAQDTAHNALESGDIQAYYVLAADYPRSRQVELVHIKPPGENATDQFWNLLQTNLLADEPAQVALRAEQGSKLTVRTPDGSRQVVEGEIVNLLLPMLLSIVFMILFMSTSTTLMQAIVQEKDSRTMEILATSLSPGQLIGGKVLAVAGMGLTLFASWVVCIAVALFFAGNVLGAEWARGISIAPQALRAIIPVAVPSYVLYCALMTALGATVADAQESQQIGGLAMLIFGVPFYAIAVLVEHPQSPLAVALSFFPLTSLTTFCLRASFSVVAAREVVVAVTILTLSALGAIWLAARLVRLGMLRYGQRVSVREILGRAGARRATASAGARRRPA